MIQKECKMYINSNLLTGCAGLNRLFCGTGHCNFYKPDLMKILGEWGVDLYDEQQNLIQEADIAKAIVKYVPKENVAYYKRVLRENYKYYKLEEELCKKYQ